MKRLTVTGYVLLLRALSVKYLADVCLFSFFFVVNGTLGLCKDECFGVVFRGIGSLLIDTHNHHHHHRHHQGLS